MYAPNLKKEEILLSAERILLYSNLLIKQCDSWLSAEEGNRIMEQRIIARNRMLKAEKASVKVKEQDKQGNKKFVNINS